jgi:hypothetical protein
MARVKLSPLITELSGSIGGATFQRNRAGITLRSKPYPKLSTSPLQSLRRSQLMQLHAAYSNLTEIQRNQWIAVTKFVNATCKNNPSASLDYHSLFLKYNYLRLLSGPFPESSPLPELPDLLTDPEFKLFPMGIESMSFFIDYNNFTIEFIGAFTPENSWFLFQMSDIKSKNTSFNKSGIKLINFVYEYSGRIHSIYPISYYFNSDFIVGSKFNYSLTWFSLFCPLIYKPLTGIGEIIEAP